MSERDKTRERTSFDIKKHSFYKRGYSTLEVPFLHRSLFPFTKEESVSLYFQ